TSHPPASPMVVFEEERVLATANATAGLEATEADSHRDVEFRRCTLLASPRGWKRNATSFPNDVGNRRLCPIREPVSVLEFDDGEEHQTKCGRLLQSGDWRTVSSRRHPAIVVKRHRTFVDQNHERDLRRISDRRKPLQHLDLLELLGRAQSRGRIVNGV